MIIPQTGQYRIDKVLQIRDACAASLQERRSLYAKRRKYFLFGSDDYRQVRYNRLLAHIDLVASFLYSADHAKYTLSPPRNSPKPLQDEALALQDDWNQEFRDSGLAYQFLTALKWALVYDSNYLKLGWNDAREKLFGKIVQPHSFGVYDEEEPDLDSQEAFLHVYRIPYDNAVLRMYRAGLQDRIDELGLAVGTDVEDLPPVLKQLLITATGGQNLSGNLMGQAPLDLQPVILYEQKSQIDTVEWQELWVWNDITEDYTTFTLAEPDILITDSRDTVKELRKAAGNGAASEAIEQLSDSNIFLPGEHPFIPVTPFELPDYAFGESHCERLIPLQDWTSERLDQIAEVLESQVDPSKVFSGFMGLSDEKAAAFGGPGTWVLDSLPNAKVDKQVPQMPEDLFLEFKEIGAIFLEASGLTETVVGRGDKGIRGGKQSKQAAITGAGRIKQTAIGLEPALVQLGDLGLRLYMRNSNEEILLPSGEKFVPAQFATDKWNLRIAGHSHSPLFVDDARELAALMFKARAIDREMLVRLLSPPQEDTIITSLRERIKVEQTMLARNPAAGGGGKAKRGAAHGT